MSAIAQRNTATYYCSHFFLIELGPKMTTDDRNFRSAYYEKVGCRSVEEKKSLEILLKEKPLNRLKLKQFCLSYTVPAVYRNLLWNLLLGSYTIIDSNNDHDLIVYFTLWIQTLLQFIQIAPALCWLNAPRSMKIC